LSLDVKLAGLTDTPAEFWKIFGGDW